METFDAQVERWQQLCARNRQGRANWKHRRVNHLVVGIVLPDLRNQEQQDLGVELEWRSRVARNEGVRQ